MAKQQTTTENARKEPKNRVETVLGIITTVVFLVSTVCALTATFVGMADRYAVAHGVLQLMFAVGMWGLPLAFVLLVTLFVVSHRARKKSTAHRA